MELYKNTTKIGEIPPDLNQIFWTYANRTVTKSVLIEKNVQNEIKPDDVKLLEFIHRVTFATKEQLITFCQNNNLYGGEPFVIEKSFKRLIDDMVLNSFYLSEEKMTRYFVEEKPEALRIYCSTTGGNIILDNFSTMETYGWDYTDVFKISGVLTKELLATKFYLEIERLKKENLYDFVTNKPFAIKVDGVGATFAANFAFSIYDEQSEQMNYVLADVFREYDSIEDIRFRIRSRNSLLVTNSWRRYYSDSDAAPTYIICVQNKRLLQFVANEISNEYAGIKMKPYFYLEEEIDKKFEENVFLEYDSSENSFHRLSEIPF